MKRTAAKQAAITVLIGKKYRGLTNAGHGRQRAKLPKSCAMLGARPPKCHGRIATPAAGERLTTDQALRFHATARMVAVGAEWKSPPYARGYWVSREHLLELVGQGLGSASLHWSYLSAKAGPRARLWCFWSPTAAFLTMIGDSYDHLKADMPDPLADFLAHAAGLNQLADLDEQIHSGPPAGRKTAIAQAAKLKRELGLDVRSPEQEQQDLENRRRADEQKKAREKAHAQELERRKKRALAADEARIAARERDPKRQRQHVEMMRRVASRGPNAPNLLSSTAAECAVYRAGQHRRARRRPCNARTRGSRRSTGSGDRAGPPQSDDRDDGDSEAPSRRRLARRPRGRR